MQLNSHQYETEWKTHRISIVPKLFKNFSSVCVSMCRLWWTCHGIFMFPLWNEMMCSSIRWQTFQCAYVKWWKGCRKKFWLDVCWLFCKYWKYNHEWVEMCQTNKELPIKNVWLFELEWLCVASNKVLHRFKSSNSEILYVSFEIERNRAKKIWQFNQIVLLFSLMMMMMKKIFRF